MALLVVCLVYGVGNGPVAPRLELFQAEEIPTLFRSVFPVAGKGARRSGNEERQGQEMDEWM